MFPNLSGGRFRVSGRWVWVLAACVSGAVHVSAGLLLSQPTSKWTLAWYWIAAWELVTPAIYYVFLESQVNIYCLEILKQYSLPSFICKCCQEHPASFSTRYTIFRLNKWNNCFLKGGREGALHFGSMVVAEFTLNYYRMEWWIWIRDIQVKILIWSQKSQDDFGPIFEPNLLTPQLKIK